uniref:WGS project CBME000000000 data, contig CS3487_c000051 n=1 Tax=Fusarium pseudograminearum CS3487 TaxID=1318458 RepID=A0A096PCW7_FUSPS|nr:unnamed protein product [Fusarium pseudograminearum CS3487]
MAGSKIIFHSHYDAQVESGTNTTGKPPQCPALVETNAKCGQAGDPDQECDLLYRMVEKKRSLLTRLYSWKVKNDLVLDRKPKIGTQEPFYFPGIAVCDEGPSARNLFAVSSIFKLAVDAVSHPELLPIPAAINILRTSYLRTAPTVAWCVPTEHSRDCPGTRVQP